MPRVTEIGSRDNALLVRLRKLAAQPDAYRKLGSVWIEGEHLCRAWLERRGGDGVQAVVAATAWSDGAVRQLLGRAESVAVLPEALMRRQSRLEAPAPYALAVPWPGAGALRPQAPTIVLDRLQDAGNVGTVLRSAAAFGFTQVVALRGTAALWSPKVMRAGMGAHLALHVVESVEEAALDALAVPLLATSSHATVEIHEAALPWPCAWLMGSEGQGLSASLLERCRQTLRIPQPGGEESLNVAVAASVCMYESSRRRLLSV